MSSNIIFLLLISVLLSLWATGLIRQAALRARFVDAPDFGGRKKHERAIPLLGGLAIYLSFFGIAAYLFYKGFIPSGYIHLKQFLALAAGGAILIAGGILDDKFNLRPKIQIIFPILAAGLAVAGGIHFTEIKNPFGGVINLGIWNLGFGIWNFLLPADVLSFLWLLGMIYTTKLLDGLDGLSAGIAAVAAIFIAAIALRPELNQPQTAMLAGILAAVFTGFLFWNFHPARIFLGEGGSTIAGFLIGSLAIAAGTKVATTLLVMGVPVLDVATVIIKRWRSGKKITESGREHLHFRLIDAGLSERQAVMFYYLFAAGFGGASWFLGTGWKMIVIILLAVIFLAALSIIEKRIKSRT